MPYAVAAAAVAAGGAIYSADQAKGAQNAATGRALDVTDRQAAAVRSDLAPYKDAGSAALGRLKALLGITEGSGKVNYGGQTWDSKDALRSALRSDYVTQLENKGLIPRGLEGDQKQAFISKYVSDDAINNVVNQATPLDDGSGGEFGSSPLLRKFSTEDLAADPVYNSGLKFGLDEGAKAIARKAAAGGGYDSGAEDKALARFASDYGSTKAADSRSRFVEDQNNVYGKLSGTAGMGSGATTVGVGAGVNSASNLAGLYSGQGNANAAAAIAGGNSISSGANSVGNYYQQQQLLQQLSGGGQRTKPTTTYDAEA